MRKFKLVFSFIIVLLFLSSCQESDEGKYKNAQASVRDDGNIIIFSSGEFGKDPLANPPTWSEPIIPAAWINLTYSFE